MPTRSVVGGFAASALVVLSFCAAPVASATTGPTITGFACSVSEVNEDEANFQCELTWTDGTAPYTVTGRSYDYGHVEGVTASGQSATVYGWCRTGKYLRVDATVTDSTSAAASTLWGGYCQNT